MNSLWYLFFCFSHIKEDVSQLFNGDITKFSREHITYIVVGSCDKNSLSFK